MIIIGRTTPARPFANVARPSAKQKTYQSRSSPAPILCSPQKEAEERDFDRDGQRLRSHVTPRAKPGHSPQVTSAAALKYPNRAERARRPKK